jgi:MFS family permease
LLAPVISGCVSPTLGWRWSFWIALIIAGASFVGVILLPETYGPKLLTEEARRQRRSGRIVFGPLEIETKSWQERLRATPNSLSPLPAYILLSSTAIFIRSLEHTQ